MNMPDGVLARQKAERRMWVALSGLTPEDAEFVAGVVYNIAQRRRYEASTAALGTQGTLVTRGRAQTEATLDGATDIAKRVQ